MAAYRVRPTGSGSYPAVIVGMELFGVTRHIRNVTYRVAEQGYLAIAPDIYHRTEPGVELTYDKAGRKRGFELLHLTTREHAIDDTYATMRFLEAHPNF